jgi:DNA-binding transcriptional ArsR family regulator
MHFGMRSRRHEREDDVFRALADPTRRSLYEQLTRGEAAVKELTAKMKVSQPAVSQHLAALKQAGLVDERRDGRHVYYRASPAGLRPLVNWIEHYQAFWLDRLPRLKSVLEELDKN